MSSSEASFFLKVTMWLLCLVSGLLSFLLGNSFSFFQASTYVLLTLLPSQLLFCFQHHLIRILYSPDCRHIEFIMNFVSRAINVPGNLLLISLPFSSSNVQFIELLCVLLHSQSSLSQVLHPPEQIYLVILGHEFFLQLGYHSIPTLDLLFAFAPPIALQFIPPQCCMSF
jgi:hypothetical protein